MTGIGTADLTGRTAVVTGAASGIGAACACRLAEAGARTVLVDLDGTAAGVLADALTARGLAAEAVAADLSRADDLERLCGPGGVAATADVLVNNAGLQHVAPLEEFPTERFALILAVMLEAPFRLVRAALPHMYGRGWGRVVNVSSVHGLRASPHKAAYVAAKHGLEGLSKVVALEGGGRGVTSNTVCPGYVRTPLVEGQIAEQARLHGIPEADVVRTVMLTAPSVKRLVEADEVAEVVAFLCSGAAASVNGASWVLDGGWSAR